MWRKREGLPHFLTSAFAWNGYFSPLGQKQMQLDYTLNIVLLSIAVSSSAYYVLFSLTLREQNCNETNGLNISV